MTNEVDHGPRLGADPELFIQTVDNTIIPVCGKIGGTKENPTIINDLIEAEYGPERGRARNPLDAALSDRKGDFAIQEDNVMLEFNIPAYRDSNQFVSAIAKILHVIDARVLAPKLLRSRFDVMCTFKAGELSKFPQALTVGCLADMNAYADPGNYERAPFCADNFGNNRFCGGHLHVQYNHNNVPRHIFAQFMDLMVGVPFIRWDRQKLRRMFYGQPGIYREKPYGIEYRTPSNFWLGKTFRDKYIVSMAENILHLARAANNNPETLKDIYRKIDWDDVQKAIKEEDAKLGEELVNYVRNDLGMYLSVMASRP